jgi:hypothetical protein
MQFNSLLSGLIFSLFPKKISNFFALIYFFSFLLINIFAKNFNHQNLININLFLGFSFFLTFFSLCFLNEKKYCFYSYDSKIKQFNYIFLIFLYFFFTKSIFFEIFSEKPDYLNQSLLHESFIYFEIISLLTFLLFNLDENSERTNSNEIELRKKLTLRYLIFHFFVGFTLLISSNDFKNSQIPLKFDENSSNFFEIFKIYGSFFALLMNAAFPFFSFWFTRLYSKFNFILFLVFANGISKISLILILKIFASNPILPFIGIFSGIFFLALLIYENNIKKFLCIAVLIQNYFFLVFNQISNNSSLTEILLHSVISQSFLFLLIFIILSLSNRKTEYFSDLHLPISQNKILFFLTILISLILIGFPGTPNFDLKNDFVTFFKNQNSLNYFLIVIYKILNLNAFLFILPYKIFSYKKDGALDYFKYKKKISFLACFLLFYFIFFKKSFGYHNFFSHFGDFFYQFCLAFLIFLAIFKTLRKNCYSFLSSDMIFDSLKSFFHIKIFSFSKSFLNHFKNIFHKISLLLKNKISFSKRIYSENSPELYILLFTFFVFCIILIKNY